MTDTAKLKELALAALEQLVGALEALLPMLKEWQDQFPEHTGDKEEPAMQEAEKALTAGRAAIAGAALAQQEPVSGQCRFSGAAWSTCDVAHVRMVLETPQEWEGYEVRYLYAAAPAPQPT